MCSPWPPFPRLQRSSTQPSCNTLSLVRLPPSKTLLLVKSANAQTLPMTRAMNLHRTLAKAATVQRKRRRIVPAFIAKKPTSPATIVCFSPLSSLPDPQAFLFPARPCQRCIKRGIANNCTEGHRKKAKYLLDEDELGQSLRCFLQAPLTIPITCPSRTTQTQ